MGVNRVGVGGCYRVGVVGFMGWEWVDGVG